MTRAVFVPQAIDLRVLSNGRVQIDNIRGKSGPGQALVDVAGINPLIHLNGGQGYSDDFRWHVTFTTKPTVRECLQLLWWALRHHPRRPEE